MKVLLIDNYDSFTYNLAQYLQVLGAEVLVLRNDAITLDEADQHGFTHLVISPGPGRPEDAGISMAAIVHFMGRIPILGVCLGHQSLAQVLGGAVVHAPGLMHGKSSLIHHDGQGIYAGLPQPFAAARYHSLVAEEASLPAELQVTARTEDGVIMGLRHRRYAVEGVQYHPESVLTPHGLDLLRNFLATQEGA